MTFHDGHEMDAEDVAFSMSAERLWGPETACAARNPLRARNRQSGSCRQIHRRGGKPACRIPNFIFRLVTPLGFVLPMHYYEEVGTEGFGQMPMGTGPYRMVSFDPSSHVEAEAYDGYWNGPVPAVENSGFRSYPSSPLVSPDLSRASST